MNEKIKSLYELSRSVNEISFSDLVELTTDYKVIPVDLTRKEDIESLQKIKCCLDKMISLCDKSRRYTGKRINEVGVSIEEEFIEELKKTDLHPLLLTGKGYPDSEIDFSYLEIKVTECDLSLKTERGGFRTFYYSNGRKIKKSKKHILICLIVKNDDRYWKIVDYRVVDLSRLLVRIKLEFNSTNKDLYSHKCDITENLKKEL